MEVDRVDADGGAVGVAVVVGEGGGLDARTLEGRSRKDLVTRAESHGRRRWDDRDTSEEAVEEYLDSEEHSAIAAGCDGREVVTASTTDHGGHRPLV